MAVEVVYVPVLIDESGERVPWTAMLRHSRRAARRAAEAAMKGEPWAQRCKLAGVARCELKVTETAR